MIVEVWEVKELEMVFKQLRRMLTFNLISSSFLFRVDLIFLSIFKAWL
jgi:hypothetical protein